MLAFNCFLIKKNTYEIHLDLNKDNITRCDKLKGDFFFVCFLTCSAGVDPGGDRIESENCLSDGVTTVFPVKMDGPTIKHLLLECSLL